jgi:hypothetical protein
LLSHHVLLTERRDTARREREMQYLFGTTPQPQEPAGVAQLGSMAVVRRVLRQLLERSGNGSLVMSAFMRMSASSPLSRKAI